MCLACQSPPTSAGRGHPVQLNARVVTEQGGSVVGAIVKLNEQQLRTNSEGKVQFLLGELSVNDRLEVSCLKGHQGHHLTRELTPLVLTSARELKYSFVCEPQLREISIAIYSQCPEVAVEVDGRLLGTTQQGLLHVRLSETIEPTHQALSQPDWRFVAQSLDPRCWLRDEQNLRWEHSTQRVVAREASTQALWVSFPGGRPRGSSQHRSTPARQVKRPSRI